MTYTIRLMNKSEVEITEQEYKNLAGKSGLVYIPSQDRMVNINSITEVLPSEVAKRETEGRGDEGFLHDGLPVVRYFGNWYLKGEMQEVNGKLVPANIIDPKYYPEVARDCVPSSREYKEKYERLPKEERLEAILGSPLGERQLSSGLKKIAGADGSPEPLDKLSCSE